MNKCNTFACTTSIFLLSCLFLSSLATAQDSAYLKLFFTQINKADTVIHIRVDKEGRIVNPDFYAKGKNVQYKIDIDPDTNYIREIKNLFRKRVELAIGNLSEEMFLLNIA